MSTLTAQEIWRQLQEQGLVEGDKPLSNGAASPWFVRLMQGVAGWIAACFLLGFVGAAFAEIMKSEEATLFLGVFGCTIAYGIFRITEHNDFGQQFGIAISFAGQSLFAIGLFNAFKEESSLFYFILFAFESLLALLLPNFIHRVLTSWGAMLALMLALSSVGLYGFSSGIAAAGFAIIWINEWCWSVHGRLWRPIGYGLCLALLQIQAWHFFDIRLFLHNSTIEASWLMLHAATISTTLITLTLLLVVRQLLMRENFSLESAVGMIAVGAALSLGLLSFIAPGVASSLLILLLGFACGNRILMGLGLVALGVFVLHYYYQLQHTLLFKSMVLAITGSVLLIIRLVLQKYFPLTDATESDHA